MKMSSLVFLVLMSACSHGPKCGNPEGAKVILMGKDSCKVRIRQVTIGSELNIPRSLKDNQFQGFTLEWVEPGLHDGRIELGHFVLIPTSQAPESK